MNVCIGIGWNWNGVFSYCFAKGSGYCVVGTHIRDIKSGGRVFVQDGAEMECLVTALPWVVGTHMRDKKPCGRLFA